MQQYSFVREGELTLATLITLDIKVSVAQKAPALHTSAHKTQLCFYAFRFSSSSNKANELLFFCWEATGLEVEKLRCVRPQLGEEIYL